MKDWMNSSIRDRKLELCSIVTRRHAENLERTNELRMKLFHSFYELEVLCGQQNKCRGVALRW